MKLGSLKEGGRDGTLIVVDRAREAGGAGERHRADPAEGARRLGGRSSRGCARSPEQLADDKAPGSFELDTTALAAPLPRAYQWADGSAYVVHVELVRKARGVEMPPSFWTDPLMYQGGSDSFIGPDDDIEAGDEAWGIDFEGEIARDRRRRADGHLARGGAQAHQAGDDPERRVAAQPHRRPSWPRASASSTASPPRPSRRSPSRPTSWAMPGTAPSSTCR